MLAGCVLFGFADAFSLRLQIFGFPSYLVLAVPYAVAIAALFALSWQSRPRLLRETLQSMGAPSPSNDPNPVPTPPPRAPDINAKAPMQRIILDVDSAGDDILAVLFAAAHPASGSKA